MITPEKLQTPEKPLDSGEASIYVLVWWWWRSYLKRQRPPHDLAFVCSALADAPMRSAE
jgi:hypothetical protein